MATTTPLPPCDCLDRCGDDSRVAQRQVAACADWLMQQAKQQQFDRLSHALHLGGHGLSAGGRATFNVAWQLGNQLASPGADPTAFWADLLQALVTLAQATLPDATRPTVVQVLASATAALAATPSPTPPTAPSA